jgi:hypothetical protein
VPNPHCEEAAHWNAALEAYHDDRVVDAWSEIELHGIGEAGLNIRWYRLIEAECVLRRRSEFRKVSEWLTLETIPTETFGCESQLARQAIEAADLVAEGLGWPHGPPVVLSILSNVSENPWATNPHGYWVNKEPFDKICLPFYLLDDEVELKRAIAHEYAHVVCGGLSSENAPTWLHEAVSVTSELLVIDESATPHPANWLSSSNLERLLDSEGVEDPDGVFTGYQQCGWIGTYLYSIGGSEKLSQLLREHGNENIAANLMRVIKGKDRVDHAVQRVYGLTVKQIFDRAEAFMRQTIAPKS